MFPYGKKDGCLVTGQLFFQFWWGACWVFLVESDFGWLEIGQELGVVFFSLLMWLFYCLTWSLKIPNWMLGRLVSFWDDEISISFVKLQGCVTRWLVQLVQLLGKRLKTSPKNWHQKLTKPSEKKHRRRLIFWDGNFEGNFSTKSETFQLLAVAIGGPTAE